MHGVTRERMGQASYGKGEERFESEIVARLARLRTMQLNYVTSANKNRDHVFNDICEGTIFLLPPNGQSTIDRSRSHSKFIRKVAFMIGRNLFGIGNVLHNMVITYGCISVLVRK